MSSLQRRSDHRICSRSFQKGFHENAHVFGPAPLGVLCLGGEATSMYISIPSITGKDPTPGYPGAMNVRSLTIAPDGFSMIKDVDTASTQITAAIVGGTPLHTATALLYNSTPSGSPDATLALQNIFGSSYTFLGGTPSLEQDQFSSTSPAYLYLDVPGITGMSSTPGYPAVMRIQSFTLNANDFSVVKSVDSASPQIASAIVDSTLFPTVNLLLYNSSVRLTSGRKWFLYCNHRGICTP